MVAVVAVVAVVAAWMAAMAEVAEVEAMAAMAEAAEVEAAAVVPWVWASSLLGDDLVVDIALVVGLRVDVEVSWRVWCQVGLAHTRSACVNWASALRLGSVLLVRS